MQDISNPGLTIQIDVEIMVIVFYLYSKGESFCFFDYIWWDSQDSPFLTNWTLGISLKHDITLNATSFDL
jgi:hypothetical protein